MNHSIFATAGAVLLLAACGSADGNKEQSGEAASEDAAPAETTAAEPAAAAGPAEAGSVPTREFVVGKWGEDGDCALAIDFKADGTMDGPVDKWAYEDGKLEMVGLPQKQHLKVVDQNTMESRLDGTGDPHKITRC